MRRLSTGGEGAPDRGDDHDYDRVYEGEELTIVDLEDCDGREVGQVYRTFAVRLIEAPMRRVLIQSGKRSPEGHLALRDVLRTLLRHVGIPADLRIALLPQTPRAQWVFEHVLLEFQRTGLEVRLFQNEDEAEAWLVE